MGGEMNKTPPYPEDPRRYFIEPSQICGGEWYHKKEEMVFSANYSLPSMRKGFR
jgi:hypothetical protein